MDRMIIKGVSVSSVVACVPSEEVQNRDACAELFGEDIESLLKATEIYSRRKANPGTTGLDLGVYAGQKLMEKTDTNTEEIGAIICVTSTPEYIMPADASAAQQRLGIPNYSVALDINMGCAGYIYGLFVAATFAGALNKKVLLLDSDVNCNVVSPYDKATMSIFSDAGSATMFEPNPNEKDWIFSFYTDGNGRDSLKIPSGGAKNPIQVSDLEYIEYKDGSKRRNVDVHMDGIAVFGFVITEVRDFLQNFMNECEMTPDTIDGFVPHQANMYLVRQLSKKLGFSPSKIWESGGLYGNPGSASVPLTIAHCANEWFKNGNGGKVLLSGFGIGLSAGVCCLELPETGYYSVVEYERLI